MATKPQKISIKSKPKYFNTDGFNFLLSERGLNQTTLAGESGISQKHISKWVTHYMDPTAPHLVTLAKFFNTSIDFLLGQSQEPHAVSETLQHPTLREFLDQGLSAEDEAELLEYIARGFKRKD